jgi:arylsulfatase A-like enzyme
MPAKQPNILVIFGDDIGWFNVSAYNHGMLGYQTPNIDRLAEEGAMFTDCYGQQSCTAGRAAFILGQSPARTGLTKIGMPGGKEGISAKDPTLAELLKPLGYATAQFGKNHLGDRDEHLPTVHGFDEFFGNLYHLNAEEEPELPSYPKNPEFRKRFGPRGVLKAKADGKGGQTVEDTGPLTKKRMETFDEEVLAATFDWLSRTKATGKPWFCWFNTTRMHIKTHLKPESQNKTGFGVYSDGMVEHDGHIGQLLDKLDELGVAEDTIVVYTTDNGAECFSWPDGGTTPFRGEKNTNWEGGYRVPFLVRGPGIKGRTKVNEILSLEDAVPTLMDLAGVPDIKEKLLKGHKGEFTTFKVHLDGYNMMPFIRGEAKEWPRKEFFYWTDDANLAAMRYEQYKIVYMKQDAHGLAVWREPLVPLRAPEIYSLRSDPFERALEEAGGYDSWFVDHMWVIVPAIGACSEYLESFRDFPPRQAPGSFNVSEALETMASTQSRA